MALLVVPTGAVQAVHKLGGVSMLAVLEYLPLVMVDLVPYLLPIGFLLGVVSTYGRLASDQELTAIRMAGVHPVHLLVPGLLIAALMALLTSWLVSSYSPSLKYLRRNYIHQAKEKAFRNLGTAGRELEVEGLSLRFERREDNRLFEVILNIGAEGEEERTIVADWAQLDFEPNVLVVSLSDAHFLSEEGEVESATPRFYVPFDKLFPKRSKDPNRPKYLSSTELRERLKTAQLTSEQRSDYLFHIHSRNAMSATYFVFLILGVGTGLKLRSGTQLAAFTGAVGYAFVYYLLAIRLGPELVNAGAAPPLLAAWATNGLGLLAGSILVYRQLWR